MIENDNEVRKTKWFPSLTDELVNIRRKRNTYCKSVSTNVK